jgi:hypothetical protein
VSTTRWLSASATRLGIPRHEQDDIFHKFVAVPPAASTAFRYGHRAGHGRYIADAHRAWWSSAVSQGIFTIFLPAMPLLPDRRLDDQATNREARIMARI